MTTSPSPLLPLVYSRLALVLVLVSFDFLLPLPSSIESPSDLLSFTDYRSLSFLSNPFKRALGTFQVWDGVHYLRLSQRRGAQVEDIAFFPAYPLLISLLSPILGATLSGVLVNSGCYVLSGLILHHYTKRHVSSNPHFLQALMITYMLSPCNVFLTAVGAEGLTSLTVWSGALSVEEVRERFDGRAQGGAKASIL